MHHRLPSLLAAATGGFLVATALWFFWQPVPARAQFGGLPSVSSLPPATSVTPGQPSPQPLAVQALDPHHFVVVTREIRLARPIGSATNKATQMLVTVVTYYTVEPNGALRGVETARMPPGWEAVPLATE